MEADEIIIYRPKETVQLESVLQESLDYALLSFAFTVNRMRLKNSAGRIRNIVKGKLAEGMLRLFANEHQLNLDWTAGETPFWKRDNFDFSWKECAWDLKNNFIHCTGLIEPENYLHLPALVPNRFPGDQFSHRFDQVEHHRGRAFLFTFISGGQGSTSLIRLNIDYQISNFLEELAAIYAGYKEADPPFATEWFWAELVKRAPRPSVHLRNTPELVICGMANAENFSFFANTDDKDSQGYALYRKRWYNFRERGGLSFCDGLIQTRIKNATCPMIALPSFKSLIDSNG